MPDIKCKQLSEVGHKRSTNGPVRLAGVGGNYVVAPTVEAFLRFGESSVSASGDWSMGDATKHKTAKQVGQNDRLRSVNNQPINAMLSNNRRHLQTTVKRFESWPFCHVNADVNETAIAMAHADNGVAETGDRAQNLKMAQLPVCGAVTSKLNCG
jgi:hypothetical protein